MLASTFLTLAAATIASAHTVITYPGWRGDNLKDTPNFPFGMQWAYPCGGMNTTTNRTYWPTTGGAVAFQPGWFQGHEKARIWVNLGIGTDGPWDGPKNMSLNMYAEFGVMGPSNGPWPGTICLPQVPLPKNLTVKAGDLATIQVVELAQHGAALYSCVDIIFADPGDPKIPEVNETNCFNSNDLGFAETYTITTRQPGQDNLTSGAETRFWYHGRKNVGWMGYIGWLPVVLGGLWVLV